MISPNLCVSVVVFTGVVRWDEPLILNCLLKKSTIFETLKMIREYAIINEGQGTRRNA